MNGILLAMEKYSEYERGCGHVGATIARNRYILRMFLGYLGEKDIRETTTADILRYLENRRTVPGPKGKLLKPTSIRLLLTVINGFFEFCVVHDICLRNPAEGIRLADRGYGKMRKIFGERDMSLFLDGIKIETPEGQRNRAFFELMYSSGLRLGEIRNLEAEQVNIDERVLLVKQGKGKKDRYVPFSETARVFLVKYMTGGRKKHLRKTKTDDKRYVFLGVRGRPSYSQLKRWFKKHLAECGLSGEYTMHSIRHTTATHLLARGAGIRYVQELLGHEDLKTTQLYARPMEENIKAVYRTYHPRENEYYMEIDDEYLAELDRLKTRLCKERVKNELYIKTKYEKEL
jgi:site-specific recombinase XerD